MLIHKVRRRVAARDVQQAGDGVEAVGSPGRAPGDREAVRVLPGARQFGPGTGCLRAAREVSIALRHHVELPDDMAVSRIKRVHTALDALVVAAGVADEDQTL